ncbi:histidine ammonia-lyase (plasmid) [Deltaproteobacteria bacterium Smac51]|nr:histidine ammonia-lyase [Deltaproteobacteria bacterium Smac51]
MIDHFFKTNPADITEVVLGAEDITLDQFIAVARHRAKLTFSDFYIERVKKSRAIIDRFLSENRLIYGVTTGFGENVRYVIPPDEAAELQRNIVRSHAASVGKPLPEEQVRAIQLQMILNTGRGVSGISFELIDLIRQTLNAQVTPYAPGDGSVGYLAVEGHLTLLLMGEGRAYYKNRLLEGGEALKQAGLTPVPLRCKEGLSLLNGSTSPTGLAVLAIYDALMAARNLDIVGCATFEAMKGTILGCDERLHSVKRHSEQHETAALMRRLLADSGIMEANKHARVQDPYVLRCTPHLHGAGKRILRQALENIWGESLSVSDNPIVFPGGADGEDTPLMGGNFDGSYVGGGADMICLASGILAKTSERRSDRMVNRFFNNGLPAFLVKNPGLNNGFMIPQYTAAALVNEIKMLSFPASVDSVPTCANQEDPVSMAYTAAKKAVQVAEKLQYITAIELMIALQALDLSGDSPAPSSIVNKLREHVRKDVPTVDEDRYFEPDMELLYQKVKSGELVTFTESIVGRLTF